MSISSGPIVNTTSLVFHYDAKNINKSWKGKPTTNWCYDQNPREDASYSSYSATASGTWNLKHPDAIRVYNDAGSEITGYVNTGVTDWTNTYHAIWVYDSVLNRPVVSMNDADGNWKAKSWGLGQTYTSMGLSAGQTYTISWLSWTTDITKCANAGIYCPNSGGSYNFWDGQSNSYSTAFNTLPYTWQRVYATFTVASGLNYAAGLSVYMYGHYGNRGIVKIADVQIETGTPSGFTKTQTRSSTQSLLDLTGRNSITINSLTYNSDSSFSFNGSSNYVSSTMATAFNMYCLDVWYYNNNAIPNNDTSIGGPSTYQTMIQFNGSYPEGINLGAWTGSLTNEAIQIWTNVSAPYYVTYNRDYVAAGWHNTVFNWNGSRYDIWTDGVKTTTYDTSAGYNAFLLNITSLQIGYSTPGYYFNGKIDSVKCYNSQLSDTQVLANFSALRTRYGI